MTTDTTITHHCHECGDEVVDSCPKHPSAIVDSISSKPAPKYRTLTLTDRPPIRIREDRWPTIARASGRSHTCHHTPIPDYETDGYFLRVRARAPDAPYDSRVIVTAVLDAASAWTGSEDCREGEVLEGGEDIAAAIRRVGERCGLPDRVIRECIADLPAQDLISDEAPEAPAD